MATKYGPVYDKTLAGKRAKKRKRKTKLKSLPLKQLNRRTVDIYLDHMHQARAHKVESPGYYAENQAAYAIRQNMNHDQVAILDAELEKHPLPPVKW